jgi:hypothetical protein
MRPTSGALCALTLLSPDIIEAILGGRQAAETTLAGLTRPFPVGWAEQQTKMSLKLSSHLMKLSTARAVR